MNEAKQLAVQEALRNLTCNCIYYGTKMGCIACVHTNCHLAILQVVFIYDLILCFVGEIFRTNINLIANHEHSIQIFPLNQLLLEHCT